MALNRSLISGALIGAATMFLLDPLRGARRRARIRDKAVRAARKTRDEFDALSRDVANRARGIAAEARARVEEGTPDPRKLIERIRAELGRVVSHPRAIDVLPMDDGRVALSGPILVSEADAAISAVKSVRGVSEVEDRLERHHAADRAPALQGGRTRPGRKSALMQTAWSPTTKLLVCLTSTAIAAGVAYAARESGGRAA